ncbi:MAG: TIGR02679 family protein [Burkholderiales bacterium]
MKSTPAPQVDPRLHKLLGGDTLAALRARLRRHFERAEPDSVPGVLRLSALSPAEYEALALLAGRPPRAATSMQLDIAALDAALRAADIADSLRDALARLDGPIAHTASARAAAHAGWAGAVAAGTHPALADWLRGPAALGLLKRLARQDAGAARQLLERADAVLHRLPARGMARAQLAAETLGNAHALDAAQPAATLVLAAWRHHTQARVDADADDDAPEPAPDERARDTWARAGVLVNELARPALFLNLPVHASEAPVGRPGEPGYLSLRRLLRAPPVWAVAGRTVFVCENPNLVAIAADHLGGLAAPLVCTDGMPAAAQRSLLTQLTEAGAQLLYHGDFDTPGVQIGNHVMRVWRARPWRFGVADYEAAVAGAPHTQRDPMDPRVSASWDDALAPLMQRHGLAIAEEAVAATLLQDLRVAPPHR